MIGNNVYLIPHTFTFRLPSIPPIKSGKSARYYFDIEVATYSQSLNYINITRLRFTSVVQAQDII